VIPGVEQPLAASQDIRRLLAGPPLDGVPESPEAHTRRLGELPGDDARRGLIAQLEESGLLGRGGAEFPVGRKWRAMAEHSKGRAVVVANGAAGQPDEGDLARIRMLTVQTAGRGACHHPDGAVQLMVSALTVFGDEFEHHALTGRCSVTGFRVMSR
jgi:NADH:ubiquinone oxidoreductase subunit F (NADH-binding)